MPKRVNPLLLEEIESAVTKQKDYKLYDGLGLYLLVTREGSKLWRLDYSFSDKRKTIAIGAFPSVSLEQARKMRDSAKRLLSNGIDPIEEKKRLSAIEKSERLSSFSQLSIHILIDESIEIWKGKAFIKLSKDEAVFVTNQINKLIV